MGRGLNLIEAVYDVVTAQFGSYDEAYIWRLLTEANKLNPITKGYIIKCFRLVDGSTSSFKKDALIDFVERGAYREETPKFFTVHTGENFCFEVDLETGQDFTGSFLTIRDAEDNALLSADNVAGSDEDIQEVTASDLSLTSGDFYKIHILLETDSGGTASGEATNLLADAIIIVKEDIDAS